VKFQTGFRLFARGRKLFSQPSENYAYAALSYAKYSGGVKMNITHTPRTSCRVIIII